MLILAPGACVVDGIALSAAFETLTRFIKYAPARSNPRFVDRYRNGKGFFYIFSLFFYVCQVMNTFYVIIFFTQCGSVAAFKIFPFTSFFPMFVLWKSIDTYESMLSLFLQSCLNICSVSY